MRRQRKHRHHPDIWRERHAEERRHRHWHARLMSRALAYRAAGGLVFTGPALIAAIHRVWDDVEPVGAR